MASGTIKKSMANKIETIVSLSTGNYIFPSDGYVVNEGNATGGLVQGSNMDSGFYVYSKSSVFVRKGMNIRVDVASAMYFLPLS